MTPYILAREIVRELEDDDEAVEVIDDLSDEWLRVEFNQRAVDLIEARILAALQNGGIKSHD